eukprot:7862557-Pyramimonas_sp.AAC.1
MIARELKKLENEIHLLREKARGHDLDARKFTNFAEKEYINKYALEAVDVLGDCKAHIRSVIEQCFSELLKMHIGVPATEEGLKHEGVKT